MKSCFGERSTRNAGWVNKKVKSVARWMASCQSAFATLRARNPASSGWPRFVFSSRKTECWFVEGQRDKPKCIFLKAYCVRKAAGHATALHAQWGCSDKTIRPKPFHWDLETVQRDAWNRWTTTLSHENCHWECFRFGSCPNVFCISIALTVWLQSVMNSSNWVMWSCGYWTMTMSGLQPQMTLGAELDYAVWSRSMNSVF